MANEAELIEPRIKSSFKKVKTDINTIRAAIRRQNEAAAELRKSFADTINREDFYQFTEKLSERIDDLRSHFVSNDEFAKATEKIAKRLSAIKQGQKQLSGLDLKAELKRINDTLKKLSDNTVEKKDYDRLVSNAEHNFNEIAKEVEASKEYDKQLKQLSRQVAELLQYRKDSDERVKQLNAELTSLVKNFGSDSKGSQKLIEKEMKRVDSRADKLEGEVAKLSDALSQRPQQKDVESKIAEEIKKIREESEFVKLEELNQKIDEFNTILDELQPREDYEKKSSQLMKERINPLEKDIATLSSQQDEMRKSVEGTITRFEKRMAVFEKSQDSTAEKLERESNERLEKRLNEIEKLADLFRETSSSSSDDSKISELQSQLSDLEEEHKAVMNELADISSKPDMNSRMLEGLGKDFQSVKERLDSMEEELEVASASSKGKGKQSEDLKYLKEELDFLRNSFVTREEVDDSINSVMDEIKSTKESASSAVSKGTSQAQNAASEAAIREVKNITAMVSDVNSSMDALSEDVHKRLGTFEADSERNNAQFTILQDDIKGVLERQALLERRLGQVEAVNSDLIRTNAEMESKVKSANDQIKEREKAIKDLEKDHARRIKEKEKEAQREITKAKKNGNTKNAQISGSVSENSQPEESVKKKRGFFSRVLLGNDEEDYYESDNNDIDFEDSHAKKPDAAKETLTVKRPSKSAPEEKERATAKEDKIKEDKKSNSKNADAKSKSSEKKSAQELIDEISKDKKKDEQKKKGKGLIGRVANFFTEDDESYDEDEKLY